ncbi:hypothetical protein [Nonomuraea sp. CA-141351]|uniref:hypothetical protein n=1 Tax=Nonomuraea sp. CA-141351 TaxID=3239996 RepID=UPI003D8A4641
MTNAFITAVRRAISWPRALPAAALVAVLAAAPVLSPAAAASARAVQAVTAAPALPLFARRSSDGHLLAYEPKPGGGFGSPVDLGGGFSAATAIVRTGISGSGRNDLYFLLGASLYYTSERGTETTVVASGWYFNNLVMTPGNLGGTATSDLIVRDTAGALWLYQGRPDGTLAARVQAGAAGWDSMNALAGFGDYTGDGKNDLLAKTSTGLLYLYPGTGSVTANGILGTRISVGSGWGFYTALVSTGDNDGDGKADLIARDSTGLLWLFKGTGVASAPFAPRVQIGTGWNGLDALF